MKAVVYDRYGPPEVLQVREVPRPIPKDNEVLVKVHAASVNPADWHLMRGEPFLARLSFGLLRPRLRILGTDVAGMVEAVGNEVGEFHEGDRIFGSSEGHGWAAFAEYVSLPESALASVPENISFEAAAAVPLVGFTALQGLRDQGRIRQGQKVLINGASGGVGTTAVQIAKSFGAKVTGVCSTRNLELVRRIGADQVVDYTQEDFTRSGQRYDLIFDTVGNRSLGDLKRALRPKGTCVVAGFTTVSHLFALMLLGPMVSRVGSKKIGQMPTASPNKEDLLYIRVLLESGKVVPVIDRVYSLDQVPEAIAYLEEGHAQGKVVITV